MIPGNDAVVVDSTMMVAVDPAASADNSLLTNRSHPRVSVVVLSYNRPNLLTQALASLQEQSYANIDVTVVDNPSDASSEVARVVSQYANVKLIQNPRNFGYAGGMNRGIATASGDFVYLTEDDIVLAPDCIQRFVDYFESSPAADLVAPVIYNKASGTIRCAGGELRLGGIYRRKIHGSGEPDAGQFPGPFEVTYIDGAGMFARRDFWKKFGGFREEYFMYVDAVELCARVAKSGKRMTIVPQAKVHHFEPMVETASAELEFHKLKNFFSLNLLHAPALSLPEFICRYAIINGFRSLFSRSGSPPGAFFKALLWVTCKAPSLLRERYRQRESTL